VNLRRSTKLQYAAVPACIALYAALCHYTNSAAQAPGLGAALALAPVIALAAILAWRRTRPLVALSLLASAGLLVYAAWPVLEKNFSLGYLMKDCGLYGLLCATFGRSLLAGSTPLCTLLADKVHGPLSPPELRYTRRVTAAWTLFFGLIALLTLVLFFTVPLRIWSFFSNFCALPLVLLMFVAEYAVRRRVLPQTTRAGLLATMRVYFAGSS
jgi:uncharacterized membrane protein